MDFLFIPLAVTLTAMALLPISALGLIDAYVLSRQPKISSHSS